MITATVHFYMKNRDEHRIDAAGATITEVYVNAVKQLNNKLARLSAPDSGQTLSEGFNIINNYRIIPHNDKPGHDKADGIAIRSPLQKIRFDLLPMGPLAQVAQVFTFGAYHYGDHNWEAGFSWSRCIGSALRHFTKWILGENNDDESGLNHLAHVIANCLFLLQYTLTKKGIDDRVKLQPKQVVDLFTPINIEKTDNQ